LTQARNSSLFLRMNWKATRQS